MNSSIHVLGHISSWGICCQWRRCGLWGLFRKKKRKTKNEKVKKKRVSSSMIKGDTICSSVSCDVRVRLGGGAAFYKFIWETQQSFIHTLLPHQLCDVCFVPWHFEVVLIGQECGEWVHPQVQKGKMKKKWVFKSNCDWKEINNYVYQRNTIPND